MSDSAKDDALGCLGILVLALVGVCLWLTWPVWTILAASAGGWWLVRKREDWWGRATATILASTSFGVATICALLFVFNAFKHTVEPRWVYELETTLVTLRIWIRQKTSLTLPSFVAVVTALVVLSYALPRLKAVSRFFTVRTWVSKTVVALVAATSFSFFSQVPLERFAVDAHERLLDEYRWSIDRYRVLLREEWNEVGRYLAAAYVEDHVDDLSSADQAIYHELFTQVADISEREFAKVDFSRQAAPQFDPLGALGIRRPSATTLAYRVAQRFAARHYDTAMAKKTAETETVDAWIARKVDAASRAAADIRKTPSTLEDWARYKEVAAAQERKCAEQEKATEVARVRADERVLALKKTFAEFVRRGVPGLDGLAGAYIEELAKKFSEHVAGEIIRGSAPESVKDSPQEIASEFARSPEIVRLEVITRTLTIDGSVLGGQRVTETLRQETLVIIQNEVKAEAAREVEAIKRDRRLAERRAEVAREAARARARGRAVPRGR
jgi:hypothetical protein